MNPVKRGQKEMPSALPPDAVRRGGETRTARDREVTARRVEGALNRMNVSAKYAGFSQAVCAAVLIVERPEYLQCVTKALYPAVAERCGTTGRCVERNLRTIAAIAWQRAPEALRSLTELPLEKKPTAAAFLAILAAYARQGSDCLSRE